MPPRNGFVSAGCAAVFWERSWSGRLAASSELGKCLGRAAQTHRNTAIAYCSRVQPKLCRPPSCSVEVEDFFDRRTPRRAVRVVGHVRLHHPPPALNDGIVPLAHQVGWILTLQVREQSQPVAEDAVVVDAEAV